MIYEAYSHYRDKYGLVTPSNGDSSLNGLRYTAEFVAALDLYGELTPTVKEDLKQTLERCHRNRGLLIRRPDVPNDQEGPDDYYATIFSAYMVHPELLNHIHARGEWGANINGEQSFLGRLIFNILSLGGRRRIKYVFNNVRPEEFTLTSWLGRQLPLVAFIKLAVGINPSYFEHLVLIIGIVLSARNDKDQDTKILTWFMVMLVRNSGFFTRIACNYWIRKFKKQWPGGVGAVLSAYFGTRNHPSCIYLNSHYGEL